MVCVFAFYVWICVDFVSVSGSGFGSLTCKWIVVCVSFESFWFLVTGISGNGR